LSTGAGHGAARCSAHGPRQIGRILVRRWNGQTCPGRQAVRTWHAANFGVHADIHRSVAGFAGVDVHKDRFLPDAVRGPGGMAGCPGTWVVPQTPANTGALTAWGEPAPVVSRPTADIAPRFAMMPRGREVSWPEAITAMARSHGRCSPSAVTSSWVKVLSTVSPVEIPVRPR
jgi:hypothetical protein